MNNDELYTIPLLTTFLDLTKTDMSETAQLESGLLQRPNHRLLGPQRGGQNDHHVS